VTSRFRWYWPALGFAGSVAIALAGAEVLRRDPIDWWFAPGFAGARVVFYAGMVALCVAWLGLGRDAHGARPRDLIVVGAVWSIPLALGPVLFSRDMYSYLAQGLIVHHGLDPYTHGPIVLGGFGDRGVLNAVSPFWRHTTAPYGPAFLALASVIAGAVSNHLIVSMLLLRALELPGLILLAIFTPRLARALGTDPGRAVWLFLVSPLVLLELVAAGHNDALMAGLLVAGVTLALERRPLPGIALCALAATVKLPAIAGVAFIAVAWARADEEPLRVAALSAAVTVVVLAAVTLVSGLGPGWISSGVLSTPGKVRLAITPGTAIGYTIYSVLHSFPSTLHGKSFEFAAAKATLIPAVIFSAVLLYRVRYRNLAWYLGLALVAVAVLGPASWPWYASWGLALLAACAAVQRSRWVPLVIALAVFVVKPNGQLLLSLTAAPYVLFVYVVAVIAALRRGSLRWPARARPGAAALKRA